MNDSPSVGKSPNDDASRPDSAARDPSERIDTDLREASTLLPRSMPPNADIAGSPHSPLPTPHSHPPSQEPSTIGRYVVRATLGRGGFGVVYRAHDPELKRDVAIKVPRAERVRSAADAESYLAEARAVARLDHAGIIPVHDVGRTADGLCYVVSKLVEGRDLAAIIRSARPPHAESAEIIAQVADALQHAHSRGLVHRDIKPANIMLDAAGRAMVADFGLALRDEDYAQGPTFAGTPLYMSPEQARGEGHRVDGRSDIYSLGVVFYVLLTGRVPYRTHEFPAVLDEITAGEIRPPRQFDQTVPRELDRICLKALSQRAADRYSTAADFAEDLRVWQQRKVGSRESGIGNRGGAALTPSADSPLPIPYSPSAPPDSPLPTPHSPSAAPRAARIVPKGLRSFDAHDADFFLDLLPGPRDRDGLPDSLRFWKARIEESDPDRSFTVGLIYGPSGCGKSSLVKAGLLPRLSENVLTVYLEATADETETRLLNGLRKRCPALPENLSLKETLAALRRGRGLPPGKKILIVLDQFEQWLHAKKEEQNTELVQALRHCDGGRVQCVVMVRDDFWLAVSRFLRELEVRLIEGQNSALADLFDVDHARKVLAAFGRAFGKLPESAAEMSQDQLEFVQQSVAGLAEEGKVVSVRLALFSEMLKGKSWTPATLKEVGGTTGVGATFLEETFSATTAPPQHRYHQHAARAVLKALLPDSGTDIKGHMRSAAELREASGYGDRPQDFDDLLRILDSETRLLTPTEAQEGNRESGVENGEQAVSGQPSAISPASGADHAASGADHAARVATPSPLVGEGRGEGAGAAKDEGGMMNDERRRDSPAPPAPPFPPATHHAPPAIPSPLPPRYYQLTHDYLVPSLRDWLTRKQRETRRGRAELLLAERAATWNARPENRQLPSLVQCCQIHSFTRKKNWTASQRRMMGRAARVHGGRVMGVMTALLLAIFLIGGYVRRERAANDLVRAGTLLKNLLTAAPDVVPVALENLAPFQPLVAGELRDTLQDESAEPSYRLHAAYALARGSGEWGVGNREDAGNGPPIPDSRLPTPHSLPPTSYLLSRIPDAPAAECRNIVLALEPHMDTVRPALLESARSEANTPAARARYATILLHLGDASAAVELAQPRPDPVLRTVLLHGLKDCEGDLSRLAETIKSLSGPPETHLSTTHLRSVPGEVGRRPGEGRVRVDTAKYQAKSALTPALSQRERGEIGHSGRPLSDASAAQASYALICGVSYYPADRVRPAEKRALIDVVRDLYPSTPGAGTHAACYYTLKKWGEEIPAIAPTAAPAGDRRWFVTEAGMTLVEIPAGSFRMGEDPRNEQQSVAVTLTRPVWFADREVTVEQFQRFVSDADYPAAEKPEKWEGIAQSYSPAPDCPVQMVNWFDAVLYCNWLSRREGLPPCYTRAGKIKIKSFNDQEIEIDDWRCDFSASGYRLPTDAEWEYAARAGTVTGFCYGDDEDPLGEYATYLNNSRSRTWPAGTRLPHPFGTFDLHGNVWEWCGDWYAESAEGKDPTGSVRGSDRVRRGGGWVDSARDCRSARRFGLVPSGRGSHLGFRVALSPSGQ